MISCSAFCCVFHPTRDAQQLQLLNQNTQSGARFSHSTGIMNSDTAQFYIVSHPLQWGHKNTNNSKNDDQKEEIPDATYSLMDVLFVIRDLQPSLTGIDFQCHQKENPEANQNRKHRSNVFAN